MSASNATEGSRRKKLRKTALGGALAAGALLGVVLAAQTGRKVSGSVVAAASGRPVVNAEVRYEDHDGAAQSTVSDEKGYFEFPSGRSGVVTVTGRGFGTARRAWPPRNGQTLRIGLVPPAAVQGSLTDGVTSQRLVGVVTTLVQHPNNYVSSTALVEDGTFRFEDLPPGPAVILAYADGYAPTLSKFTAMAGKDQNVQIGLKTEAKIAGRVLAANAAASGARLRVTYMNTLPGARMLAGLVGGHDVTEADGTFILTGLAPDTPVTVHAEDTVGRTASATNTISAGVTWSDVVLRLQ